MYRYVWDQACMIFSQPANTRPWRQPGLAIYLVISHKLWLVVIGGWLEHFTLAEPHVCRRTQVAEFLQKVHWLRVHTRYCTSTTAPQLLLLGVVFKSHFIFANESVRPLKAYLTVNPLVFLCRRIRWPPTKIWSRSTIPFRTMKTISCNQELFFYAQCLYSEVDHMTSIEVSLLCTCEYLVVCWIANVSVGLLIFVNVASLSWWCIVDDMWISSPRQMCVEQASCTKFPSVYMHSRYPYITPWTMFGVLICILTHWICISHISCVLQCITKCA